ncbi:MAG: hypothetical protein Q7R97_05130 [Candidatus Daviesbacteria bacterium]|nr:hypothetical protein [Candidatus Daviesbacteria bacterium]
MNKKSFLIILVLSVVVTYGVMFIQAFWTNSLIAGSGGFPFSFTSSSLFSTASTDYQMLIVNIVFWFMILFVIWKLIGKLLKK